jgi:transposase
MPSIRKTKTASDATAVQVVQYENRKVVVLKHVGSGRTDEEIVSLVGAAEEWISQKASQLQLFPTKPDRIVNLQTTRFLGVHYTFAYSIISTMITRCGFTALKDQLLLDLVLMRLFEPCSKKQTLVLLKRYFGIEYTERTLYRTLQKMIIHKEKTEDLCVSFAKRELNCKLSFVFYDVTTLYFESFTPDELRKNGFSKDGKSNQPQIMMGLMVNKEGFPVGYDIFEGNTFEGHTMIQLVKTFQKKHRVDSLTVVADAGMLSMSNIQDLVANKLSYVVGARMAGITSTILDNIVMELNQIDGKTIRVSTNRGELVCSFSKKRFRKDNNELEKQVTRAKALVKKHEPGKRAKFISKEKTKDGYTLNEKLITKSKKLLGIKGYYTNIPIGKMKNEEVIDQYQNLWRVEQSFRMTKSDLVARPIFHYKKDAVKAHMLICFMALAVGKYMELKTGLSLRRLIELLKSVTDAILVDAAREQNITLRSEVGEDVKELVDDLEMSY